MNNRNINAAGKPQTIRTALEKLSSETRRRSRRSHARRQADSFARHLRRFALTGVCYSSVNGIAVPVPMG